MDEQDFTDDEQFAAHLGDLAMQWQELGIDSDDFLRCAVCMELMFDPENKFAPREHCQDTRYLICTASGMSYARVEPWQGGREAAIRAAREIGGVVYPLSKNLLPDRFAIADFRPKEGL